MEALENIKSNDEKSRLVQMRLQPKTLESLDSLSGMTRTTNKTLLVSFSIQLAEEIIKNLEDHSKIYIEHKNGEKEVLKIIGI
jgi:hypothetical protein